MQVCSALSVALVVIAVALECFLCYFFPLKLTPTSISLRRCLHAGWSGCSGVHGGPKISWRPGRTDSAKPTSVPDGRLPDADKGVPAATNSHIRDIFCRMGFNDQEIVALSGAHALGRCHTNASGYWGPWTYAESTFSNE